jgi:hypothetical protein
MAELVHQQRCAVARSGGREYDVLMFATRVDGRWIGQLEFRPRAGGLVLQTGAETAQPTKTAVAVWAARLAATDLEAAFERAFDRASETQQRSGYERTRAHER